MSGYLNNPPRTILIDGDNRPGSYPSHISPTDINASNNIKPFRDTIALDTPQAYGKSLVTFNRVPANGHEIDIVNSNGASFKFIFLPNSSLTLATNQYIVDTTSLRVSEGRSDLGLDASNLTIRNYVQKFITVVNSVSDLYVTASPGETFREVILTQNIPGEVGNTSNASTSSDITIEDFSGASDLEVRYPLKVYSFSNEKPSAEIIRRVISKNYPGTLQPNSGTLLVNTSGDARQVEAYSEQHGFGIFSPFDESNSHQSFGIGGSRRGNISYASRDYGTQTRLYEKFISQGSISGSFDEPLRTKDKIVIDLTPVESTSLKFVEGPGVDQYTMAYFNFNSKKWERIGLGDNPSDASTLEDELNACYAGFNSSHNVYTIDPGPGTGFSVDIFDKRLRETFSGSKKIFVNSAWMSPIDTFGFPLHPKYHATSSQTFNSSLVIDRPFLLEKLVYEFSGSTDGLAKTVFDPIANDRFYLGGGATFFVLNQRKSNPSPGQDTRYTNGSYINGTQFVYKSEIPQNKILSQGASATYVDSVRDLITFSRVGTVWDEYNDEIADAVEEGFPHPAKFMDLAIHVPTSKSFDGHFTISDNIKSPSYNSSISFYDLMGAGGSIYTSKNSLTRNSLDISTGRSIGAEFTAAQTLAVIKNTSNNKFSILEKDAINSPYLILPGDNLVFGWQSQINDGLGESGDAARFSIGPGSGKLILYGSYINDEKPVHNIFKDQLISDSAHEAIPAGPWSLDVFDTEPAMMYTGSMREEYVRGMMLIRTGSNWVPVNESNINLVRRVRARVSDGDVQQRWSLNRNVRLIDPNEQYYDSMQLNPLKVLFDYKNSTSKILAYSGLGYALLMLPNENDLFYTHINTYANKKFIGSFAYEDPLYSSIERIKSINSSVITNNAAGSIDGSTGNTYRPIPIYKIQIAGGFTALNTLDTIIYNKKALKENGAQSDPLGLAHLYFDNLNDTNIVDEAAGDDDILRADQINPYSLRQEKINYHLSRFFGCFGDGYLGMMQYGTQSSYLYFKNQIYRGTRYGLINPTPFYSNAVYVANHYGQFRDMLEQRQYTRFSTEDNAVTDSAVEVVFINRNTQLDPFGNPYNSVVNGIQTNSTNVSTFCTSSIPYDDSLWSKGWIRDRLDPLPETLAT